MALDIKQKHKGMIISNFVEFVGNSIVGKSAEKKDEIVSNILSEGAQLTLLAILVEQIGDSVGLDTPEFAYAKQEWLKIKNVLVENGQLKIGNFTSKSVIPKRRKRRKKVMSV